MQPRSGLSTVGLLGLVLVAPLLFGAAFLGEFNRSVAVTAASTPVFFGMVADCVLVRNDGASEVFVSLSTTASTTAKASLLSGEWLRTCVGPLEGLGLVTAAGGAATVRVHAERKP